MVSSSRTFLVAALFCQTLSIYTVPVELISRDIDADWKTTPFTDCMKGKCSAFPQGPCKQEDLLTCHGQSGKIKRSPVGIEVDADVSLAPRDVALTFTTDQDPTCESSSLPKNFMMVNDICAGAQGWC